MTYFPNKKEFVKLSRKGNLIPLYREIMADFETPVSAFKKISKDRYSFLLESVEGGERIARYTFLGSNPSLVFSSKGKKVKIREGKKVVSFETPHDPLYELKKIMKRFKFVKVKGLPRFCGGLVGYMGYDMVRFIESIPDDNPDDLKLSDSIFMLTDTILIFDHVDHTIKVVSNVHVTGNPEKAYREGVAKIDGLIKKLRKNASASDGRSIMKKKGKKRITLSSNFNKQSFVEAVKKTKRYIKKGDAIQVVLSQRFQTPISSDPFDVYRALRSVNPSPYMYYLNFPEFKIIGASPEIMVRCEEGVVELRPIAGTRPRGKTEEEDRLLAKDLLQDAKERAEHVMLVDLGRNDVGKVCDYKSVRVTDLMTIEKYSHVMHIVSDVKGSLKKGKDAYDVMRAAFPAGTVSGAPKVRAMEIIDELENLRRGTYAGSIGYFSFSGNLDSCITIRTIVVKNKVAYIQAGAGIVAYSNPEKEYVETKNKARALFKAIEFAEQGLS